MKRFRKRKTSAYQEFLHNTQLSDDQHMHLSADAVHNEHMFRELFQNCSDITYRKIRKNGELQWLLIYADSLVDKKIIEEHVLKPLISNGMSFEDGEPDKIEVLDDRTISVEQTKLTSKVTDVVRHVLKGDVAVIGAAQKSALLVGAKGGKERSLEEPSSEPVIRGPKVGFNENISTNIGLLRSRLPTPRFKLESFTVGDLTQTKVVIAYIQGIVTDSVVQEVRSRVSRIEIDGVLESGYIEEFIEDLPFSPFPQVQNTERPDAVIAGMLEGRVAILVDSTPFALMVPMTFWSGMQSSEDYYERFFIATVIRWIRFIFLFIALFLPSLYVAITTYHQEMIPYNLLMSIIDAREAAPFPALIEALLMEITFEALREAGVRLPKPAGQAVSIVGGLVIGQAAVQAGIISAPMIIVVSITGIASFTMPRFNLGIGIRMLRFPMIFLAGSLGLYGLSLGFLAILLHLTSLRSFGIPYFAPVAPYTRGGWRDTVIRVPWWANVLRPRLTGYENPIRESPGQQPGPDQGKGGTEGN